MATVKCAGCGSAIDKSSAYKVAVGKSNRYYCTESEYLSVQKCKADKDNAYNLSCEIMGYRVTNTALFKELCDLSIVYGYELIATYLDDKKQWLYSQLDKQFSSEYAKIRYFAAILKNNLSDYKQTKKVEVNKQTDFELLNTNYQRKQKRVGFNDIE